MVLVLNRPVFTCRTSDALDGIEHIPLTDEERGDIHVIVPELGQMRTVVILVFREDLQAEKVGNGLSTQWPRAGIDLRVSIVNEDGFPLYKIETETLRAVFHTEFVPKITGDGDPGAYPQVLNLSEGLRVSVSLFTVAVRI